MQQEGSKPGEACALCSGSQLSRPARDRPGSWSQEFQFALLCKECQAENIRLGEESPHTHPNTHTNRHTRTYTPTHPHTPTHTYPHTHQRTYIHPNTHTNTYTHYIPQYTHVKTYTLKHTHLTYTHTPTHIPVQHTPTHTHIFLLKCDVIFIIFSSALSPRECWVYIMLGATVLCSQGGCGQKVEL